VGLRTAAELPEFYEHFRPSVLPYIHPLLDVQQYPAWLVWLMQLFGVLVLSVVAINVAILVYARTAARQAELTVRTALGAARPRIIGQLFVEALAMTLAAAVLGLALANVGYERLFSLTNSSFLPYWIGYGRLAPSTIAYAVVLAVIAAFVVGVLPALRATGRDLQSRLRQMAGGTDVQMGTTWTVLVVTQVAVAVGVLPIVVGVGVGALWTPLPEPAFPAAEVLTFSLVRDRDPYAADRETLDASFQRAQSDFINRVAAEPGVAGVTFARHLPLWAPGTTLEIEGIPGTDTRIDARMNAVAPGYFRVLGLPLLAGREFEPADLEQGAAPVIVNRAFVERYLGDRPPLGTRVRQLSGRDEAGRGDWHVITGVVGDMYVNRVRPELTPAAIYSPLQLASEPLALAARTRGTTPGELAPRVRAAAAAAASEWPLTVSSMAGIHNGPQQQFNRMAITLVALMTLSVLLLSAAGIAALMSFAVTRRRREIGIRVALGASQGRLMGAVFMRPARQLGLGLVIGAVAAAALDNLTGGQMLDGRAVLLLPLVAALMVLAGLLATLAPARRAMRIHPVQALRD
jgi:putative ABC transport system permease protein